MGAGTRRTRSRGRRPEAGGRAGEDDEDGEVREKNLLRLIGDYTNYIYTSLISGGGA